LIFVSFGRFRKKPTKEMTEEASRLVYTEMVKEGIIKVLS